MKKVLWLIAIIMFALGAAYAVEGPQFFRWRTRAAMLLEPPAQAELSRAVEDSAKPKLAEKGAGKQASAGKMFAWTLGIITGVLVLAVATSGVSVDTARRDRGS